jgi:hypothetical protein
MNLSESFDIGYEIAGDPSKSLSTDILPPDPFELYGGNQWADDSVLPGFRTTYLAYFRVCIALSRKLLRIFALALDLDEGYFDGFVTFPGCMSRLLHYPPQAVQGEERVGIEAHTVRLSLHCFGTVRYIVPKKMLADFFRTLNASLSFPKTPCPRSRSSTRVTSGSLQRRYRIHWS